MGFLGYQYKIQGWKDTPTGSTKGAIADAGPFEVYAEIEDASGKIMGTNANAETGGGWDYTASAQGEYGDIIDEYTGNTILTGSVTLGGTVYKNVLGAQDLNEGCTITTGQGVNKFIFRSVNNCTNAFDYIPPTPPASVTPTPSATLTVTPSNTMTPSKTPSVSISATATPSVTPSVTPTSTATPSATATATPSVTPTRTPTISVTPTKTPSISISSTPGYSATPTVTPTVTPTGTPPITPSVTPSSTPAATATPTATVTPSKTPSVSVTATVTPSVTPSNTPSISVTPSTSALNLTSVTLYKNTNSMSDACNQTGGSTGTYYHDGASSYPTTGDRVYRQSNGSALAGQGYYASTLGYGVDDGLVINSSGYVTSTDDCENYCVVKGTNISTSTSTSVLVENLNNNDTVLSKNINTLIDSDNSNTLQLWESDNIDGTQSTATVVNNQVSYPPTVLNFNNGTLKTTKAHLHIVKRGSKWTIKRASDVIIGDKWQDINGDEVEITSITTETWNQEVYKLNVETDDVYYANGILTHNIK